MGDLWFLHIQGKISCNTNSFYCGYSHFPPTPSIMYWRIFSQIDAQFKQSKWKDLPKTYSSCNLRPYTIYFWENSNWFGTLLNARRIIDFTFLHYLPYHLLLEDLNWIPLSKIILSEPIGRETSPRQDLS